MKATIKVKKDVDIRIVRISIAPRYIGDSDDDDIPSDFPLLDLGRGVWNADVLIDTGEIVDWPKGDPRSMHVKVCDAGIYSLLDAEGNVLAEHDGYVPHGVVPGSYGDYVELTINENGVITNWPKDPSLDDFFNRDED